MMMSAHQPHEQSSASAMELLNTGQVELSSNPTIINMMGDLFRMNSAGVACLRGGRDDEAFFLFEKGLSACGVDISQLYGQHVYAFLPRLQSSANCKTCSSLITPHATTTAFLQTVDTSQEQQQPTGDNTFELYESALLLDPQETFLESRCKSTEEKQTMIILAHHLAPVMLFNLGLLVHKLAISSSNHFLAHELYRMSLYLMEENTIHGLYCKSFDVLLLALFNNLCELNCSFYKQDRVALCREKFVAVFHNLDQSQVDADDYKFFHEQLIFSGDTFPVAAAAA